MSLFYFCFFFELKQTGQVPWAEPGAGGQTASTLARGLPRSSDGERDSFAWSFFLLTKLDLGLALDHRDGLGSGDPC
jgi:hypothetical protein